MKDCVFSLAFFGLCLSAAAVKPESASKQDADTAHGDVASELPALDSFMAEYDEILGSMSQEADALKTKLTEGRSSTWTQLLQKKKGYEHKLKGALRINQKIAGENQQLKEDNAKLQREVDVDIKHLSGVQNSNSKSKKAMENLAKQLKVADVVIHKSIDHVKGKAQESIAVASAHAAHEKKIKRSDIRRVEVVEETPDEKDADEEAAFLGEEKQTEVEEKGKAKAAEAPAHLVNEFKESIRREETHAEDVSKKASQPEKMSKDVRQESEVKTSSKEPAKKLDENAAPLSAKVGMPKEPSALSSVAGMAKLAEKSEQKWEEAYGTSSGHVPLRFRVQKIYEEQDERKKAFERMVSTAASTKKNTEKHEPAKKLDEHAALSSKSDMQELAEEPAAFPSKVALPRLAEEKTKKAEEHVLTYGATKKKADEKGAKHAAAKGDKHVAASKKPFSWKWNSESGLLQTTRDRLQDAQPADILTMLRENVRSMSTEQDSSEQDLWNQFKGKVKQTFRERRFLQHENEDLKERKRKLESYKLELEDSSKKAEHVQKFLLREVNKESSYLRKVQRVQPFEEA